MATSYRQIINDGLWTNNVGFVQLLGLCPLLAVTGTAINGLGLGLATLLILMCSNVTISLIRNIVPSEVRLPIFVLVIASFVTTVEMLMKAFYFDLYMVLGIFIPLIVTNCAIIGRAEAFASKQPVKYALLDGVTMGVGFLIALVLLGGMREVLGQGTLFAQAHLMFGEAAHAMTITIFDDYKGFLIAILPPGAFFGLGFLIALKNWIDQKRTKKEKTTITIMGAEPSHT